MEGGVKIPSIKGGFSDPLKRNINTFDAIYR